MRNSSIYKEIFEPEVITTAPRFADRSMMMTADGEIRVYGTKFFMHENGSNKVIFTMLTSKDNGLSFSLKEVADDSVGATVFSPWSGDYLTLLTLHKELNSTCFCMENEISAAIQKNWQEEDGVFVFRSNSPDGPWESHKICDFPIHLQRLPLPLKKHKRWINVGQITCEDKRQHPIVLLSDDDGVSWRYKILPAPPEFQIRYPHCGVRWLDPGVEPAFAETASGKIIMLLRTSQDVHYECFSEDGGETWSEMKPSIFYSVATMPGIYTLSDGRLLAIWNNTCPLPELDHSKQYRLSAEELNGVFEDVFTNRDAVHGAISGDDGRSWFGFRELALNPLRNNGDFRSIDGSWYLLDKSVHQNQILELPDNKILLHCGQHKKSSQLIIFDLNYLYVKERKEDFRYGLQNVSTHIYYQSYSGGCRGAGHCSWNRRSGAQLMPIFDDKWSEALLIGRHADERLFSDREGVAWNFPASSKGVVTIDLTLNQNNCGIRVSLLDRWVNPCDEYVKDYAPFSFVIDGDGCVNGEKIAETAKRFSLQMEYDLEGSILKILVSGKQLILPYSRTVAPPFGKEVNISYLHLQSAAEDIDSAGVFLHCMQMKANQ